MIRAPIELDACTGVAAGLDGAESLAEARHCSVKGMRVLLDALVMPDLLRGKGERHALSIEAAEYLDRASLNCAGDGLRFLMSSIMELAFSHFTGVVRSGCAGGAQSEASARTVLVSIK